MVMEVCIRTHSPYWVVCVNQRDGASKKPMILVAKYSGDITSVGLCTVRNLKLHSPQAR